MLSNIVTYEINITSDDFINKKIKQKINGKKTVSFSMESVLGANCRIPSINISNRKIWIEETNQRINKFSFGYMLNPFLHTNKGF